MRAIVRSIPSSYAQATVRSALGAIDVDRAHQQHAAYVDALQTLGAEIHEVPVADDLPDSCFVEDNAVVTDEIALGCRIGHAPRRAESDAVLAVLARFRPVVRMTEGTLDGGDVLRVGRTIFVGLSARTDAAGLAALEHTFSPHG